MGVVTEIFFYSNYIYDFINNNHGFTLLKHSNVRKIEKLRGYDELYKKSRFHKEDCNNKIKPVNKVCGIMLADDEDGFFTFIDDAYFLKIMNDNRNEDLNYYKCKYHFDVTPSKIYE